VPVAAAPKKEVDPVEEEKKRKRAEKFGAVVPVSGSFLSFGDFVGLEREIGLGWVEVGW